jgi:hypothetical protein
VAAVAPQALTSDFRGPEPGKLLKTKHEGKLNGKERGRKLRRRQDERYEGSSHRLNSPNGSG